MGVFIPLIVVNCIILGRAEAFANKNNVVLAFADGLGMGVGYTIALTFVGIIRELIGSGTVFGHVVLGSWYQPMILVILPPGAFIVLGLILGALNKIQEKAGNN